MLIPKVTLVPAEKYVTTSRLNVGLRKTLAFSRCPPVTDYANDCKDSWRRCLARPDCKVSFGQVAVHDSTARTVTQLMRAMPQVEEDANGSSRLSAALLKRVDRFRADRTITGFTEQKCNQSGFKLRPHRRFERERMSVQRHCDRSVRMRFLVIAQSGIDRPDLRISRRETESQRTRSLRLYLQCRWNVEHSAWILCGGR